MYIPKKFRQDNIEQLVSIIEQYPFATLISTTEEDIDAMHLPMLIEQNGESLTLKAHIAKANSLWKKINSGANVLVIFHGPNCYISPNHYPTKLENGKAVPTWNYVVVHVKGTIEYSHDPKWIYDVVNSLTNKHEVNSKEPWSISDAPQEFIEKMLPAIVGIKVEIKSIIGQWKLSQNQPEINQYGVIDGLNKLSDSMSQRVSTMVQTQMK